MTKQFYKTEHYLIALFVIVNLVVHVIADFNSGFHGDELLHIDAGNHPAFGYMDFAPMIAYLAYFQNLFQSDTLLVNHLFVHLASALILLLCGLMTIKLGGKWLAVFATLSCIMFSPGFGASHSLFLPTLFEQLAWVMCLYILVSYCNNPKSKYMVTLGIFAALGFLTKYSISFLIAGFIISVLIFQREILKKKVFWMAIVLFLIIIFPNIIWQVNNEFPVFRHVSKLYEVQLENNSRLVELKSLVLFLNPFVSVFWIAALLIFPFVDAFKKYRLVAFSLLIAFVLLFIAKGKVYYYFPIVLGLLPLGAVLVENLLKKRKAILIAYLTILVVFGIVILPRGIPVLPLDKYIGIYGPSKNADNKIPLTFENYYSKGIWDQVLKFVQKTYRDLPVAEQKDCLIWGRHYSQAGGINLLGKRYGLPHAFSFHSSYYNWVPDFPKDITMIVVSDVSWDKEHWLRYFKEVEEVDTIENPYATDKEWYFQHIFLCHKLLYNSDELKQKFRNEIF
jgi:hypothetical protein